MCGNLFHDRSINLKLQAEYLLMLWAQTRDNPDQHSVFLSELPAIQRLIHDWLSQVTLSTFPYRYHLSRLAGTPTGVVHVLGLSQH